MREEISLFFENSNHLPTLNENLGIEFCLNTYQIDFKQIFLV
jgi:hypothetical protein